MIPVILLVAALCLPPGVPPLEAMTYVYGSVGTYENVRGEQVMATGGVYVHTATQHLYLIVIVNGAVALVDDHHEDLDATDWYVDGGVVTDEISPRVQADPKSTCQFHRRGHRT